MLAQLNAEQEEQSTLAKSLPAEGGEDDQAIQAAAADAGAEPANPEDAAGAEPALAKSMTVGGEEVEVVDAEPLIKSLADLTGRVDEHDSVLAKGLTGALDLIKTQGEMIKSLSSRVEKLSGEGRGRKTVLAITERPAALEQLAKSEQQQVHPGEILAKALNAQAAGKLSGQDVARCEAALNAGSTVPADILSRL
ncbi:hypothetical protein [Kaistia sp. 32K]|uniref:hypothetical protein n=1 Tax=Kaistia sp. 32K TaxID=2795690 RepID=UPI0019165359|nr:hypothetical protein [Kaistia sp. 32K]